MTEDWIANRIRSEHKKYAKCMPDDWAELAAAKIRNSMRHRLGLNIYIPNKPINEANWEYSTQDSDEEYQMWGYFDEDNGIAFKLKNGKLYYVTRKDGVDTEKRVYDDE